MLEWFLQSLPSALLSCRAFTMRQLAATTSVEIYSLRVRCGCYEMDMDVTFCLLRFRNSYCQQELPHGRVGSPFISIRHIKSVNGKLCAKNNVYYAGQPLQICGHTFVFAYLCPWCYVYSVCVCVYVYVCTIVAQLLK